jgi:DNA-binding transcriptional LysR family regulator
MDKLTGLQLFIRLVESGSFSRTARDMKLSQPTVTKHIAALEARLGVRLLNRNTRGMRLTEAGALYYERCKIIERELEAADRLVTNLGEDISGPLRVACPAGLGRHVILPLAREFMARNPGVRFDLQLDDHTLNLLEHGIDVAVRMGRLADSALGSRQLGLNPWVTVASPSYVAHQGMPAMPEALATHDCLVYSSVPGDQRWDYRAADDSVVAVAVSGPLRTNDIDSILAAALAGMGVAILPAYLARTAIAREALVPLLSDHTLQPQPMHAVYPSPRLVPTKVLAWIEFMQTQLGDPHWPTRDWDLVALR